jgi:broad specificity phosphatase PhoE
MGITLVFETHATTTDNESGFATGHLPGTLSDAGRAQARELGERRRVDRIDAVYVSDLRRAVETAELAFADGRLPVHQDSRLRECDYGQLNGRAVTEIDAGRSRRITTPFPGGESYRQAVQRMEAFLRDLAAVHGDGQRLLLIGHRATRWALDCLLGGASLEALVEEPFAWRPGWEYVLPAGLMPPSVARRRGSPTRPG